MSQEVRLVDTVIDVPIDKQVNEVMANGIKRRAVSPPSIEAIPNKVVPVVKKNNRIGDVTVKKARKKARRFPVKLKKSKVWSRLMNAEAGISVAEWISLDKEAASEVIDGIRFLREQRPKNSRVKAGGTGINGAGVGAGVVGVGVGENGAGVGAINGHGMDINEVLIDTDSSVGSSNESYETESESSDEGNSSIDIESVRNVAGDESDLEFSDVESYYRYPYNLQKMKSGSPLRAAISINGKPVEAVFDTGASVSILGSRIATELGLVPNGDKLHLVGFNQHEEIPSESSVIMDVPICIGGKIRPEHMAVQLSGSTSEVCLLGVPWFQAYGISLDLQRSQVCVPTSNGIIRVQGRTKHVIRNHSGLNKKEQEIYHVAASQKFSVTLEDDLIPTGQEGDLGFDKTQEMVYTADNISEGVHEELKEVVERYKGCFSEVSGLTCIKGYTAKIRLKENAVPVRHRPFRLGWSDQDLVDEYVQEMLDLGIVVPSKGEWSSCLFLVNKKETSVKRPVVDFRAANKMIIQENFPTATVPELIETVGNAKVFSTFDCTSGYHQLELEDDGAEVTGFVTSRGAFQYKRLAQGLTIGCSQFQRVMSSIFKEYIGDFVSVFLDDILVFSKNMEDHKKHLILMFEACEKSNLKLKRKKCNFGRDKVEYLGHVLGADGNSPGERNVIKIKNFPVPNNATDIRSFLGLSGYYRKYVHRYGEIAEPLNKLTRKNCTFVWGEEQQLAFETLKNALVTAPILSSPLREAVQCISCDASFKGISYIASQVDSWDGLENEQVLSYGSRGLHGSETRFSIHHLEALSVVCGVRYYKHWLKGKKFILITDHSSLVHIFSNPKGSPKLSRWAAALLDYDFEIRYRPGKMNPADPLSRKIVDLEVGNLDDIIKIV